jgi:hypothetical protein
LFGTFRGTLSDTDGAEAREDAKSTLRSIPTKDFLLYLGGSAACVLVWYAAIPYKLTIVPALAVSSLVGFGPVVLASAMSGSANTPIVKGTAMNTFGNLLHTLIGMLFCSVPIMYMCYLAVSK